jgi:hypothetical protein
VFKIYTLDSSFLLIDKTHPNAESIKDYGNKEGINDTKHWGNDLCLNEAF